MNEVTGLPSKLIDESIGLPKNKNTLGKDDFMKLLLSQLKNQDPLRPMDHQEFASQLAQFGQLEQLTNIGTGISGLKSAVGDDAKVQAIGMIGKRVQATGAEVDLISGQPVSLNSNFSETVKPVKAMIMDASGKTVRELNLDGKSKEILWDGKDQEGVSLPSGKYLFRVHGVGPNGQSQEAGSELSGRVVGVEMDGSEPRLIVQTQAGQTKVALAKVKQVMLDTETAPPASAPQQIQKVIPKAPGLLTGVSKVAEPDEEVAENRRDPMSLFMEQSPEVTFR